MANSVAYALHGWSNVSLNQHRTHRIELLLAISDNEIRGCTLGWRITCVDVRISGVGSISYPNSPVKIYLGGQEWLNVKHAVTTTIRLSL